METGRPSDWLIEEKRGQTSIVFHKIFSPALVGHHYMFNKFSAVTPYFKVELKIKL